MWTFKKSGPLDSNRRSKLDEFFSSQNAATSVVRESIQNSLDASRDEKDSNVVVRFTLSEHPWDAIAGFAGTTDAGLTLDDHTGCPDLDRYSKSFAGKTLRCLAIEDYGTKGLTGSTDKDDAHSGSNFVGFWWNEGITGKGVGTRGSHGVGKTTLTRVSDMSTFWALTKRADDDQTFLIGFANLPFHRLKERSYLGYGRFGISVADNHGVDRFMPIVDEAVIAKFGAVFGLDRLDCGLSVLIPAVAQSIGHDSILQAVIEDYYWPILRGDLEVIILDQITGIETEVNKGNLSAAMDKLKDVSRSKHIRELVSAATRVHGMKSGDANYFPGIQPAFEDDGKHRRARLTGECFTPENLTRIKNEFEKGEMVAAQFAVTLEKTEGQPVIGKFEIFLRDHMDGQPEKISQYIRNGLIITDQSSGISGPFGCCFVMIDDRDMSDFLVAAEGPAHTNWVLGKLNEAGTYKFDWPLRFVMEAASKLHRILTGEDQDKNEIENFAEDIFSIDKPGAGTSPEPQKKSHKKTETPTPPVQAKPAEMIRVERRDDATGYAIHPAKNLIEVMQSEGATLPFRIEIISAYLSVKGNSRSFKDYTTLDFDYAKTINIETTPADAVAILERGGNRFTVEVLKPGFTINVFGFDRHRDLLNRTELKILEGEAA